MDSGGMALQRGDDATDLCIGSIKRKRVTEFGNCTQWSELPADLLELILKQVGVIENLMFACVCKSWRSVAKAFKQEFMAAQGPLVFLMSRKPRKYCYFYNLFDNRLYRAALPHLPGNKCLGFTCGYLVLRDSESTREKENIWLVNPFTRHELEFPRPPNQYDHVILASLAKSDTEFVIVAFSRLYPYLQFCRSGDINWTVFTFVRNSSMVIDVSVFKGKIYLLTSKGKIGTLNFNSNPMLSFLHVKSVSATADDLHLVASSEDLYIAHFRPDLSFIKIHRLDFERMEWESVTLKGEVLFLGERKCCGLSFPTPSKGRFCKDLNQVFYLEGGGIISVPMARYVAGGLSQLMCITRKDGKPKIFLSPPLWYFPHLSCTVDSVYED